MSGSKVIYTICTNCSCEITRKNLKVCPKCGEYIVYPDSVKEEPSKAQPQAQQSVNPQPMEPAANQMSKNIPNTQKNPRPLSTGSVPLPPNGGQASVLPQYTQPQAPVAPVAPPLQVQSPAEQNVSEQNYSDLDDIDFSEDEVQVDNSVYSQDEEIFDENSDDWDDPEDQDDSANDDEDIYENEDDDENFDESDDEEANYDDSEEYDESDSDLDESDEGEEYDDYEENEEEEDIEFDENEDEDEEYEESDEEYEEDYEEPEPEPVPVSRSRKARGSLYDVAMSGGERQGKSSRQREKKQKNLEEIAGSKTVHMSERERPQQSQKNYDPNHDGYYDDVLPLINDAIYKVPKDIIIKGIFMLIAVLASIIYLIYNV